MTEVIILRDGLGACCSEDPRLSIDRHPLAGGSMSSTQQGTKTVAAEGFLSGIPQSIVVEKDAEVNIVIVVFPQTSCDVRLDVRLVGAGAEANIYGA